MKRTRPARTGDFRAIGVRLRPWMRRWLEGAATRRQATVNYEAIIRLQASMFLDQIFNANDDNKALKLMHDLKKKMDNLKPGSDLMTGFKPGNAKDFNELNLGFQVEKRGAKWVVVDDAGNWHANGPKQMQAVQAAYLLLDLRIAQSDGIDG
ncbi:hypothetical protein AAFN47_20330 [Hoeflea sp. CAU 1731]